MTEAPELPRDGGAADRAVTERSRLHPAELLALFNTLPLRLRLAVLTLAIAGAARLTGADEAAVRALLGPAPAAQAPAPDAERADQEALRAR